ncbi:hypothetical protein CBS101457_005774 [Exobasidium rhododendri]|nr:hypothetical protein CBS101457_005774 [Exobasidium rhododendri]
MASRKSQQNSAASVLDGYEPLEVIGSGTFGLIRKVKRISDGKIFARKELQFDRMTDRDRKQIVAEVNILRGLQHENIVKYEERFIDRENQILYIVMEYCEGGDLGSTIKRCRKTSTLLPEEMVWSYVSQMVLGLDACHYRGQQPPAGPSCNNNGGSASPTEEMTIPSSAVLHRDLKPENVFLDGNQNIKIGDFGLSKEVAAQSFACTYVGTPYYMSPELATGSPYDIKADIWALGCVAFELCALAPPFDAQDQAELTRKIKLGHIPELPRGYSSELGNLIRSMMDLNPKRRPTTKHLLREHPVRLACRTIELATMSRKITLEKTKLRAQYFELEMRERAITTREQEVASYQASFSHNEERMLALDHRERLLQAREQVILQKEQALEQRKSRESREDDKVKSSVRHSEGSSGSNSHYHHHHHHATSGMGIRRPVAVKRVSSGTVARYSSGGAAAAAESSGSGAFEGNHHARPAAITPRSLKAEAIRQRFGKVGGGQITLGPSRLEVEKSLQQGRRRSSSSEGSEEWVDNEFETDNENGKSRPSSRPSSSQDVQRRDTTATVASQRSRRFSSNNDTSTNSIAATQDKVSPSESIEEMASSVRSVPRPRSVRKSMTTLTPSARAWVNEIMRGNTTDLGEDVSMRDASVFWHGSSEDKENHEVRGDDEEGGGGDHKGFSLPLQGETATRYVKSRPTLTSRATIATEHPEAVLPPAVYDISNDEDLPSPFLRKVTRHNNEVLNKRGAPKNGSNGLVGPTNFLARAAAAGAARQSIQAVKDTSTSSKKTAIPALATSPVRRKSAMAVALTGRLAMPASSSLTDIKNGNVSPAPPVIKRRSSALPGATGAPSSKGINSLSSARKSCLPPPMPTLRQRAA